MKIKKKIEKINYDNFIEQYIKACGIEDTKKYLHPSRSCFEKPSLYANMKDAIKLFDKHIGENHKIGIIMDSDLDGACSTAIMIMFCRKYANINPIVYVHSGKQHGIRDKIEEILSDKVELLIVPDAGTNDVEDCQRIKDAYGGDILILDHHEVLYDNPYATIINNQIGNVNKNLSGTGVTYKFIQAYCSAHKLEKPNFEDIVAVSIISDICDLRSIENRAFLYYGLKNPTNPFLIELFNTVCQYHGVNPVGVGWDIAPLANALSRMNELEYKSFFLHCLIGDENNYESAIKEMKRIKRKQDSLVKEITNEIESNLDLNQKVIVGFTEPENKEILGLIANKFTGKYRKPTILLRELNSTMWTGSLRSPIDLLNIINESRLAQCLGHGAACGITVKKANLKKLIDFLNNSDLEIKPEFEVAGELNIKDINLDFAQSIIDYKILWGKNIETPQFYIHLNNPSIDIFKKSTNTIKITQDGISFLKFFCSSEMVEKFENLNNNSINLIFEFDINEYNGVKSPQGNIIEWEIEENLLSENKKNEFDWDKIFV